MCVRHAGRRAARTRPGNRPLPSRVRLAAFGVLVSLVWGTPAAATDADGAVGDVAGAAAHVADESESATILVVRGPGAAAAIAAIEPAGEMRAIPALGAVAIELPAAAADAAEAQLTELLEPGASVHRSVPFTLASVSAPNDPLYRYQWRHGRTRTDRAWATTTGVASVTIAVIDTGVDASHPDLLGRVLRGHNVPASGQTAAVDPDGHGTAVALVAAAAGDNGYGVAGTCWTCTILPVNVAGPNGSIQSAHVAEGIVWAAGNGADIINISLGGGHDPLVADAVRFARSRGVLVVASAGNWPESNMSRDAATYPARYASVLGVEASDTTDRLYSFSHYGKGVDIAAPGCDRSPETPGGWFCGTSTSAPVVSGTAALALATGTISRPVDLRDHLTASATPRSSLTAGRLDSLALLRRVAPCGHPSANLVVGAFRSAGSPVSGCFDPRDGRWRVSDGSGDPRTTTTWARFSTRTGWQSHLAGDITRDGRDDVVSYHPGTGNWRLSRSTGTRFSTSVWTRFSTRSGWQTHLIGAVTAPGRSDVLSYHPDTGNWILTAGTADAVRSRRFAQYRTRTGWAAHLLADVTKDGRDDVLSYHRRSGKWILTPAATRQSRVFTTYKTTTGWAAHLTGDVTGDGRHDLLSYHSGTGHWILTPAATGRSRVHTTYRTTDGWASHRLADVTGDGRAELVSHHAGRGNIVVTTASGDASVWARGATAPFEVIAATEATGDNRADLLVRDGAALATFRSTGRAFQRP
jgi:hypothetical protein